ncbi:MAG: hydratase, partial [Oscillospiraceae bacterium]
MINLSDNGVYLINGNKIINDDNNVSDAILSLGKKPISKDEAKKGTIAYGIMQAHNIGGDKNALKIRFDAMASHDITFVGIIQTARASGLREFPMPYVLTNCHNTLCAVGGTINEDDHVFGLS